MNTCHTSFCHKVALTHRAMSEEDRCWICLGSDGEIPPLAQPGESRSLVSPCFCSLKAHRRCLIDWASDREFKARLLNESDNVPGGFQEAASIPIVKSGFAGVVSLKSKRGWKYYTSKDVRCPQCQSNIVLSMKPSSILSFSNIVKSAAREASKYVTLTILGSTFIIAGSVSLFSWITSVGVKLFHAIAPQSVQMTLLSLQDRNMDSAMVNGTIGLKQLSVYAGLPIFLYSLRSKNAALYFLGNVYPVLFFDDLRSISWKDPRLWLSLLQPLHEVYEFIYSITFNRVYYRWVQTIKPFFLADRLPVEELEEIEEENSRFVDLESKRLESLKDMPWYEKLYHWYLPAYSPKENEIVKLRRSREWKNILTRDFTSVFQKKSKFTKILTTLLWPFAGQVVGIGLSKLSFVRSLVNNAAGTPDEATYLINILGICVSAFLKDCLNLFIAWRQVKEYQNMDIVDSQFTGFEVGSMTIYEPELARGDVMAYDNQIRDRLDQAIEDQWNPNDGVPVWDLRFGRMALTSLSSLASELWNAAVQTNNDNI